MLGNRPMLNIPRRARLLASPRTEERHAPEC